MFEIITSHRQCDRCKKDKVACEVSAAPKNAKVGRSSCDHCKQAKRPCSLRTSEGAVIVREKEDGVEVIEGSAGQQEGQEEVQEGDEEEEDGEDHPRA